MRKALVVSIVVLVMLSCNVLAATFSDLASNHWAYKPISDMTEKGILIGYPDGTFKPNQSITRAEFAKILVTTLNLTGDTSNNIKFNDVSTDHWSYNYVKIASRYLTGYQNGNEYLYMPDSAAVREDMALAIVTAMGLNNNNYKASTLDKFSDKNLISDNLKKYVAIAAENGLMNGNADGTFNPKGSLTRAEVCQLMTNALNNLEKIAMNTTEKEQPKNEQTKKKVELSTDKKDGSTLVETDSIKLSAKNYDAEAGTLDYRVFYDGKLLLPGSFKAGDSLKVKDIIDAAKKQNIDLIGKEITLTLLFDNIDEDKAEGTISYEYEIASINNKTIVPIKEALVEAQLEGETLESGFEQGLYYEFFVKYNRPLKEAKVEAKDQNGKSVSLVDARVATEYEEDAVNNDISTVRIRIKFEYGKRYTFTIKNVIDKEGRSIENYSFDVSTIVKIKDALVNAQMEGKTVEPTGNALYYESFVVYNRPLKEAKVEVKNAFDEPVKIVEGKVASEYEEDAVNNDISTVRIRMKLESKEIYTITVKDVVDKNGFKIEDYTFVVKVSEEKQAKKVALAIVKDELKGKKSLKRTDNIKLTLNRELSSDEKASLTVAVAGSPDGQYADDIVKVSGKELTISGSDLFKVVEDNKEYFGVKTIHGAKISITIGVSENDIQIAQTSKNVTLDSKLTIASDSLKNKTTLKRTDDIKLTFDRAIGSYEKASLTVAVAGSPDGQYADDIVKVSGKELTISGSDLFKVIEDNKEYFGIKTIEGTKITITIGVSENDSQLLIKKQDVTL